MTWPSTRSSETRSSQAVCPLSWTWPAWRCWPRRWSRSWPPWCCSLTALGPRRQGCSSWLPRPPARRRPTNLLVGETHVQRPLQRGNAASVRGHLAVRGGQGQVLYAVRALKYTICAIQCMFGTCWRCYVYSTQASIPYSTYSTCRKGSAGWRSVRAAFCMVFAWFLHDMWNSLFFCTVLHAVFCMT